jgi:uncharacterized protein (TIGR02391 family)
MPTVVEQRGFREDPSPLCSLIPEPENVLALEPEELGGVLLEMWNQLPDWKSTRHDFRLPYTVAGYPEEHKNKLLRALMEAWVWLEREGLIVPDPDQTDWYVLSRRGKRLKQRTDLTAYRNASALPRQLLHPVIVEKAYAEFLRGDYATAVFSAFREIEIAVREAGKFSATDLGVELMRKAFNENGGQLTDMREPISERAALSHLFAGAIGRYKNPSSHRAVPIEVDEAVEVLSLASRLMKIVDEKRPS